jgi:hypothetical protein
MLGSETILINGTIRKTPKVSIIALKKNAKESQ